MVDRDPDEDDDDEDPGRAGLEQALADYMERVDRGEPVDRDRFLAEHPEFAGDLSAYFEASDDLLRLTFPDRHGDWASTTGLTWEAAPAAVVGPRRGDRVRYFGDYELLEEIARGGMGVVYRARQISLNRPVALKMILEGRLASRADVERFRIEAEAAANLDHPHIVPIYEIGEHHGQHYFSMKLIRGGSLDHPSARPGGDRRAIARLVATIARTVHHAHQRGILHRDLKPANILIDAEGQPHLTDFGLARRVGGDAGHSSGTGLAGTPSYMAPEQAAGRCRELTTAVDVYGIGAILYELLSGHPPFRGSSPVEVIWRLLEQPPEGLRARDRSIHRDLETICLKCLAKDPARRYRSAEALADDLERWLAGKPIRARPVGWPERLTSWCRRQPALATLALVGLGGFIGVATQWWRAESHLAAAIRARRLAEESSQLQFKANRALRLANDREATARRRAQERFDSALKALGGFEAITQDAALLREPRMQGLRANLLRATLGYYHELQASLEDDASPVARSQLSDAYARIAYISWELGLGEEALATYRRALALVEQSAGAAPATPDTRAALAQCHARIGFTLRTMGRPREALASYECARRIQEALVRDDADDPRHRESLSWTLSNLGVIHLARGRLAESILLHRQAIGLHEALAAGAPGNTCYLSDLAWCRHYLGEALLASGHPAAALETAERAAASLEEIVDGRSGEVEDRWRLARCRDEIGTILVRLGRPAEAGNPLEIAARCHRELVRDNLALYRIDLIRNSLYIACQRAATGRADDALASILRAEELMGEGPAIRPETLYDLACAYSALGAATPGGRPSSGSERAHAEKAIAALRRAVATDDGVLARIVRDPLLAPLRSRRDFVELIMPFYLAEVLL